VPIHIEELQSEVAVFDGELPFSEAQLAKLTALISSRLAQRERTAERRGLPRRSVVPRLEARG
jgi:hypothetical protein